MLTVEVDDSYARVIDKAIADTRLYSSRSEFLKDSIRKNLVDMLSISESFRKFHEETEKLAKIVKERGGPRKISRAQREALAKKFMKENNIA
ncbi:MAG: ribbon-helix-helix protein, CopG family [archaeon]